MVEDVVPMAGTSRMVDDEVPISVEGSSRIVENPMPVGSVVRFSFFNYWTRDKILVFAHRQMSTLLLQADFIQLTGILLNGGPGGIVHWLARGPPKAGLAASIDIKKSSIYRCHPC